MGPGPEAGKYGHRLLIAYCLVLQIVCMYTMQVCSCVSVLGEAGHMVPYMNLEDNLGVSVLVSHLVLRQGLFVLFKWVSQNSWPMTFQGFSSLLPTRHRSSGIKDA